MDISPDFPVRGLISCSCEGHITAAWSKGCKERFGYYSCTNSKCSFYRKSILKKSIEDGFIQIIKGIAIKDDVVKVVEVIFDKVWKEEISSLEKEEKILIGTMRELDNKIHELTDLARKAKNERMRVVYESQIEEAAYELEETRSSKIPIGSDSMIPYRTALKRATTLLENPYSIWKKMEVEE